jgi:hypothetical protein
MQPGSTKIQKAVEAINYLSENIHSLIREKTNLEFDLKVITQEKAFLDQNLVQMTASRAKLESYLPSSNLE